MTPASSFTYTITVSEVTTGSGTVTATVSGESIKLQRGEQNEYVLVVSGGSYKVKTGTLSKVSSIKYNGSEVPYRAINADALEALLTTGNTKGYGTGTYTVVTTSQIAGFATNTELKAQADIANFLIGLDAIASTPISQGSTSGS